MHRALGLLLLAAEGALAQSREPSQWDANVPAYGGTIDGCPCDWTRHDCIDPDNAVVVEQTGTSAATATFAKNVPLKFAYLTDQDGTIISYKAGDAAWNLAIIPNSTITFGWDASKQPTGLVPHLVYADSCADVSPHADVNTSVFTSTWVRQGPHPTARTRSTMLGPRPARVPCASTQSRPPRHSTSLRVPSQRTKLALLTQTYDAPSLSPISKPRPLARSLLG